MATQSNTTFSAGYPSYPVAGSATINSGDLVLVYNASGTAPGYVIAGANTANTSYVGVAIQTVVNSGTVNGAISVNVMPPGRSYPEMTYLGGSPTQAIVGLHVFSYSNQTVALVASASNGACVGQVVAFNQQGDSGTVVIEDAARFTAATA